MASVSAVCRKYDVCSSTFYRWQKQYSNASGFSCAFSSDPAKKLAILESEQTEHSYSVRPSRNSLRKKNWKTLR